MAETAHTLFNRLAPDLRRKSVSRRGQLLGTGQVSQALFLIETGCLRLFHIDVRGNDITLQFFLGGEIVGSFSSLFSAEPSRYGIDAVVPTTVRVLPRGRLLKMLEGDQATLGLVFSYLTRRLADYQLLFLDTIRSTPQERYELLLAQSPALFDIVPQHYIASYLGITPVSLSRIRKRVASVNKG